MDPAADARGFADWSSLRRVCLGAFRNWLRRCTSRTWRAVAGGRRGVTVTQVLTVTRTASVARAVAVAVGVARSAAVAFACSPPASSAAAAAAAGSAASAACCGGARSCGGLLRELRRGSFSRGGADPAR